MVRWNLYVTPSPGSPGGHLMLLPLVVHFILDIVWVWYHTWTDSKFTIADKVAINRPRKIRNEQHDLYNANIQYNNKTDINDNC